MSIVGVVGDCTTTTALALAAAWPDSDVAVMEADTRGGSLAAWLDTPASPSLATILANSSIGTRGLDDTIEAMTRTSRSGIRFIANAVRSRPASRALEESTAVLLPALAASDRVVIADTGSHRVGGPVSPLLVASSTVLVVHRQATASAAAATVRIERLVEVVEDLVHLDASLLLAVIGSDPFDPDEITEFVRTSVPDVLLGGTIQLADDPLTAATLAGRVGVSARRLRRLPLMRDATTIAARIALVLDRHPVAP